MSYVPETDKRYWGEGPWQNEPDLLEWVDPATGYSCVATRHPSMGHWCGYVGIPLKHPAARKDYDGFSSKIAKRRRRKYNSEMRRIRKYSEKDQTSHLTKMKHLSRHNAPKSLVGRHVRELSVHGGLTYANREMYGDHIKGKWVFGFDCCHAWDLIPGLEAYKYFKPPNVEVDIEDITIAKMQVTLSRGFTMNNSYRDLDFVKKEITSLALQLYEIEFNMKGRK